MTLLAKSDGKTLEEHINDTLNVLTALRGRIPLKDEDFWRLVKQALVLHDVGKAHQDFQKSLLKQTNKWRQQRHELFSLPFVLGMDLPEEQKEVIFYLVAFHHKSVEDLMQAIDRYDVDDDFDVSDIDDEVLTFEDEFSRVPVDLVKGILEKFDLQVNRLVVTGLRQRISKYRRQDGGIEKWLKLAQMAGAFKHCDHLASAGLVELEKLPEQEFESLEKLDLYTHQQKSAQVKGNLILTAPTGSGKTETALLWLRHQLAESGGNVYYVLPYTASINAMYHRLEKIFKGKVSVVHGKIDSFLEFQFTDDDLIEDKKEVKDQFKSMVRPIKVVTPFQLLKHIFMIKGFEKGIFELTGSYLIFDEIHAYDPDVFAQIIVLIDFAVKYLHAKVMIMTATLPSILRHELTSVLGEYTEVRADKALYDSFTRHRVVLLDGLIEESLDRIKRDIDSGKKVLIVCNTVAKAQLIYSRLDTQDKLLLHGGFNEEDRNNKEQMLKDHEAQVLVGTQAIEVSLDIDYDVIYTEVAPLDALLQRFGRVNRRRQKGIADCYVFRDRSDVDKFIYPNEKVINRTIEVIHQNQEKNDRVIYEKDLQQFIDYVYNEWHKEDKEKFLHRKESLYRALKVDFKPFAYNPRNEEDFYKQFDGIPVLPVSLLDRYKGFVAERNFVRAEALKVSLRQRKFFRLLNEGLVGKEFFAYEGGKEHVTVLKMKYDHELGLIEEYEQADISQDQFL